MYLAPSMHSHEILIKILKGKSIHLVQVYYFFFLERRIMRLREVYLLFQSLSVNCRAGIQSLLSNSSQLCWDDGEGFCLRQEKHLQRGGGGEGRERV